MTPVVLLVDDEEPILRSVARVLLDEPVELLTATSPAEAVGILDQRPVAVLMTDHHLRGMTGVDLLRETRTKRPNCTRILFSGHVDVGLLQEAVNAGEIAVFITKPWDDDEVVLAVRQGVERWRLLEERDRLVRQQTDNNHQLRRMNDLLREEVDRTGESLAVHGRALNLGQEVLDHLPLVVVGVDPEEAVTTLNLLATELLPDLEPDSPLTDGLPAPLAALWPNLRDGNPRPHTVELNGGTWHFQSVPLAERGLVLVGFQLQGPTDKGMM